MSMHLHNNAQITLLTLYAYLQKPSPIVNKAGKSHWTFPMEALHSTAFRMVGRICK